VHSSFRIGFGYDIHRFAPDRKLVLGGIEIPFSKGLEGHSDADVLLHAIADALLGAAALGDIGRHFPDTDPRYKGISSLILLRHVADLLSHHRYSVENLDATVVLEAPKISEHVELMRDAVADALAVERTRISIKATTREGLDSIGRGEGAAAYAVALVVSTGESARERRKPARKIGRGRK
jgi:2-C-methyl-D-erythritol 2,4-cyclodiphosphate synthase